MTNHIATGLLAIAVTASIAAAHGPNGNETNGEPKKGEPISNFFDDVVVSATPGSGITFDAGDAFKLTVQNVAQVKWTYASMENAPNMNTFDVRRARTNLYGHAYNRNIQYRVVNQWDETQSIKDAWIRWDFVNEGDNRIGVRFGQSKTQFGRSATGSFMFLEFVERDVATRAFADSRSRGAAILGHHLPDDKLRWSFGIYNGTTAAGAATNVGEQGFNDDNELNFIATVNFDPMGDITGGATDNFYQQADLRDSDANDQFLLSLGAGVEVANASGGAAGDVEGTSININAATKVKGFHGLAEVFLRSDDPQNGTEEDATGFNIQGSYTAPRTEGSDLRWGGALRVSQLTLDDVPTVGLTGTQLGAQSGDIFEIGFGINAFYKNHNMKTQINYTMQQVEPDGGGDADNHIIDIMFTLIF